MMRWFQRVRLFVELLCILGLGWLLSAALSMLAGDYSLPVFLAGASASVWLAEKVRRRMAPWNVEHEADAWIKLRAARLRHPIRYKYLRMARRVLIWMPTAIAAFVLLFLPVATHAVHPRLVIAGYRIGIPWNCAVFEDYDEWHVIISSEGKGRFGMTPVPILLFQTQGPRLSHITFGSGRKPFDWVFWKPSEDAIRTRDYRLGRVTLFCRQRWNRDRATWWPIHEFVWTVACQTPATAESESFDAIFFGRDEDLELFYRIMQGVRPTR